MHELGLNPTDVAAAGGITRQTVAAFFAGETWPRPTSLSAIDRGLQWPPGRIAELATRTSPPDTQEPAPEDEEGFVVGWPDDLTDDERDAFKAAITYEAFRRAQEIRASRRT